MKKALGTTFFIVFAELWLSVLASPAFAFGYDKKGEEAKEIVMKGVVISSGYESTYHQMLVKYKDELYACIGGWGFNKELKFECMTTN